MAAVARAWRRWPCFTALVARYYGGTSVLATAHQDSCSNGRRNEQESHRSHGNRAVKRAEPASCFGEVRTNGRRWIRTSDFHRVRTAHTRETPLFFSTGDAQIIQ